MSLSYSVVSIGALSRNRFWEELEPRRAAHSTTTLIRDGKTTILVDPGAPEQVLAQRLDERTGLSPEAIQIVFLTTFRPVHRRALKLFSKARWLMHAPEIEAMGAHLDELSHKVNEQPGSEQDEDAGLRQVSKLVADERALLGRIQPAPEKLTRQVHLFPLPGLTPGSAGLLVNEPSRTIVVAGDAVINQDYYEAGRVYEQPHDLEAAQESFREVMEIADVIIPGHDNLFIVPGR